MGRRPARHPSVPTRWQAALPHVPVYHVLPNWSNWPFGSITTGNAAVLLPAYGCSG